MADDTDIENEDGEGENQAKKKPGLVKLALFIGLPALILVLGGVAGALFLFGGKDDTHVAAAEGHGGPDSATPAEQALAAAAAEHKYTFEEPMVVNINHESGTSDVLMLNVYFVYSDPALHAVLEARSEEIFSSFTGFVRELRTEDLAGSSAYYRLRLELLRRVNLEIAPAQIDDVLIRELVVN
ncbi:hypothetical protein E5163_02475 [Marinicauda algicola]|uniref:Flagellar protein FliL n=1 Tax=Marinicauda algicola TaxID=2029849 RepID=A0A4S2H383_9PROT|nr:flagellar basal body-associated FliL family protein [Marinicauda algicola]TGY90016.1 hypothetical protein E5163_02475 [Marinicauda algicola]